MRRVFLPLQGQPICGHFPRYDKKLGGVVHGDLMLGREESSYVYHGKKADYFGIVEYGPCSHCNRAAEKRIEKQAKRMDKCA